ncbi:Sugar transferases involved in lipopolysaccharide synthesis [Coprococcus catus GD/7]|uniref:Sugar transferases involved in lipopolysaccharide synthesis n=2 Tax=Coprococcus catus TaxID=116085 RepID=D4J4T9_9FIRM|nr:Sugar transferases involved in lipopolysaccharide synthesis [Coprococcus catus GD/7]
MYKQFGKRVIGIFLSICGLVVCCIPMLIITVLIKLDSKGPALFKQERLGKNQKPFIVYKFRTMCNHAYEMGGVATRSDDARITKVGSVLRRTSLDELPQMFNIIKGDMAIIGPRPILPIEFEEYKNNKRYAHRYDVLPGMFCTVDIDYRSSSDRDLQFSMDADYVDNISFGLDVKTFFSIIAPVVKGKNVYREEVKRDK